MKKAICILLLFVFLAGQARAGLDIVRSNGITLTGADGINYIGTSGITLTGADGLLLYRSNGITLTGADGITLTAADGITLTGADGATYTGSNGITLTGADGITLTGADGITLTGADGITLTGADGTIYKADSIIVRRPNGITLTGADGITLTGADGITLTGADGATRSGTNGITLTGADGITLTGADGITLTGADGITLTGADAVTGIGPNGIVFDQVEPAGITLTGADGITLTGADGITLTGADGITLTGADGITLTGADGITLTGADDKTGLQSVDPELAITLNNATDDSNINAVIVYHSAVTDGDLERLREIGIVGGTRFKALPMIYVTATRQQILSASRFASVRSIYGNRTLNFNADPYFKPTGVDRVPSDRDLNDRNAGIPVTGRNVTVAVLDTGINSQHADLAGKVVQNVRLVDVQSAPAGFADPIPVENVPNTDMAAGHGTFVAGVIAASGSLSGGKYSGVATGARLLGLSAGDANLTSVLSGFDYLLAKGSVYNVKVVNCSFSANTVFDPHDPVNVATKMLTDLGVNVVFSAGNTGPGNNTLNPYAAAPWVISVGATDERGMLATFSSRGSFGGYGQPTVVAPGVNVASLRSLPTTTSIGGIAGADTQRLSVAEMPYYTTASGTSFSAPQVAGAIAMMLEVNPNLSPSEVKDVLSRTATPLPRHFHHEAGAGMVNTHSAVLEAAFPDRRMGIFRSWLARNSIRFVTSQTQLFSGSVTPGSERSVNVQIPENAVQASIAVSWGLGANDFGLKLFSGSQLVGQSNQLNLPGLTGRQEKVILRNPASQTYRAGIHHSFGTGTVQTVNGIVEVTRVEYPRLSDLDSLTPELLIDAERSLMFNVLLPEGSRFRPDWAVSRYELAAAFVRAGLVPQYVAGKAAYLDVRDILTRNAVESAQQGIRGRLILDVSADRFHPHSSATRLAAVVALVRAGDLESEANGAVMPLGVSDIADIPVQWRGHVALALQKGLIRLHGTRVNPNKALTRMELAQAINRLIH